MRTMNESGILKVLEKELNSYRLEILGLSEIKWNGFGEITTQEGNVLIYSGQKDENRTRRAGVGILMTNRAKKGLMDWKPISERIITARFKTKVRNITIVQCYAPTEEASEEEKEAYYDQLEMITQNIKKQDIKIFIGDMNAKVGQENNGNERVMGKHGLGVRNDNGNRFIEFCGNNELVIGGTLFPHKECHKPTWTSPNGRIKNQIDHIAISKKWRSSLLDTRNRRGADCGSDHHLVTADIRLKIASNQKQLEKRQKRYNTDKLKNKETKREFNLELKNRFERLTLEDEEVEQKWNKIKEMMEETSKEILGYKRKNKKPWISEETWKIIEERKKLKQRKEQAKSVEDIRETSKEYNAKHKEVKRSFRRDKRVWIEGLAKEAQEAAEIGNIKELYKITKTLSNKKFNTRKPVKDKEGKMIINEEKQLERWREYFEELFNKEIEDGEEEEREIENIEDPRISILPPTKTEIMKAIKEIKSGKAPGADNIEPEILKANPELTADILHNLLEEIWEKEIIPEDWKKGLLIKLPKKGDLSLCNNWRGITLLSIPSKILTRIILNRIKDIVDNKLRKEQAGFRKERSCIDMINTLRIVVEQSTEYQTPLYLSFVDFEKAFDSLRRDTMWRALKQFGIPSKIINIIRVIYKEYKCQVIHEGKITKPFNVKTGVRQGCLLSPIIFIMVLDGVMRKSTKKPRGIQWSLTERLEDIDFADDLCLMSHRLIDMKEKMEELSKEGKKVGLKINESKTKEMRINSKNQEELLVDGKVIEQVEQFQYLGSLVSKNGGTDEDVQQRIRKAKGAFAQLAPI